MLPSHDSNHDSREKSGKDSLSSACVRDSRRLSRRSATAGAATSDNRAAGRGEKKPNNVGVRGVHVGPLRGQHDLVETTQLHLNRARPGTMQVARP